MSANPATALERGLTARQARFVAEYLVDGNGTQAAIRAGYAPGSAKVTASRLLTNANVAEALAARRAELADQLNITETRVLGELAKLGFADCPLDNLRPSDKLAALDKLARHLGLFEQDNRQQAPATTVRFIMVLDGDDEGEVIDSVNVPTEHDGDSNA